MLAGLINKYIKITIKVHLKSLESNIIETVVSLDSKICDLIDPFQRASGNFFMAFANGTQLDSKKKFGEYDFLSGSKMLLFPLNKSAKPDGVRWWCRFPKHDIVDYIYTSTSDQGICFIPSEDIDVVGWGSYMH